MKTVISVLASFILVGCGSVTEPTPAPVGWTNEQVSSALTKCNVSLSQKIQEIKATQICECYINSVISTFTKVQVDDMRANDVKVYQDILEQKMNICVRSIL
jgi:hypothetical protein